MVPEYKFEINQDQIFSDMRFPLREEQKSEFDKTNKTCVCGAVWVAKTSLNPSSDIWPKKVMKEFKKGLFSSLLPLKD